MSLTNNAYLIYRGGTHYQIVGSNLDTTPVASDLFVVNRSGSEFNVRYDQVLSRVLDGDWTYAYDPDGAQHGKVSGEDFKALVIEQLAATTNVSISKAGAPYEFTAVDGVYQGSNVELGVAAPTISEPFWTVDRNGNDFLDIQIDSSNYTYNGSDLFRLDGSGSHRGVKLNNGNYLFLANKHIIEFDRDNLTKPIITPVNITYTGPDLATLVGSETVMIAFGSYRGPQYSTDRGLNWTPLNTTSLGGYGINTQIAFGYNRNTGLFTGVPRPSTSGANSFVYTSTDCVNWTQTANATSQSGNITGFTNRTFYDLVVDSSNGYLYFAVGVNPNTYIWRSTDGGVNWTNINASGTIPYYTSIPSIKVTNGKIVFNGRPSATQSGGDSFTVGWYSDNQGSTWTQTNINLTYGGSHRIYLYGDEVEDTRLVVVYNDFSLATFDAVGPTAQKKEVRYFKSTDGGATFAELSQKGINFEQAYIMGTDIVVVKDQKNLAQVIDNTSTWNGTDFNGHTDNEISLFQRYSDSLNEVISIDRQTYPYPAPTINVAELVPTFTPAEITGNPALGQYYDPDPANTLISGGAPVFLGFYASAPQRRATSVSGSSRSDITGFSGLKFIKYFGNGDGLAATSETNVATYRLNSNNSNSTLFNINVSSYGNISTPKITSLVTGLDDSQTNRFRLAVGRSTQSDGNGDCDVLTVGDILNTSSTADFNTVDFFTPVRKVKLIENNNLEQFTIAALSVDGANPGPIVKNDVNYWSDNIYPNPLNINVGNASAFLSDYKGVGNALPGGNPFSFDLVNDYTPGELFAPGLTYAYFIDTSNNLIIQQYSSGSANNNVPGGQFLFRCGNPPISGSVLWMGYGPNDHYFVVNSSNTATVHGFKSKSSWISNSNPTTFGRAVSTGGLVFAWASGGQVLYYTEDGQTWYNLGDVTPGSEQILDVSLHYDELAIATSGGRITFRTLAYVNDVIPPNQNTDYNWSRKTYGNKYTSFGFVGDINTGNTYRQYGTTYITSYDYFVV